MTTTQFPTEFPVLSVHEGVRGGPYVMGHDRETCPEARDARVLPSEAGDDSPWPCGTCFPWRRSSDRMVAMEDSHAFSGGSGSPAPREARIPSAEETEAIEYARSYSGSFEFMVSMREKAGRASWIPTPAMTAAILKCKARDAAPKAEGAAKVGGASSKSSDLARTLLAEREGNEDAETIRRALNAARESGGLTQAIVSKAIDSLKLIPANRPKAGAPSDLPEVPAGRYAVDTDEGHLAFYQVDRPDEGKWAGRTFLSVMASDERHPIRGAAAATILAKIAVDPQAAMRRYGVEIGECGRCHRTLTDETSRKFGVGPDCKKILGW